MKKLLLSTSLLLIAAIASAQNCIPNPSSIGFSSSYVSFSTNNNLDLTDSITIEAWVYANSFGASSAENSIVCNHGWYTGEQGYVLRAGGNGQVSFNLACDSAGTLAGWRDLISPTGALQLNTWHHVAATFSGMESKIYIDGVLVGTRTFGGNLSIIPSTNISLKIGRLADDLQPFDRYWDGKIDEVRIWHRVLSVQDITMNMNHHINPATVTGLVGYWRFNENLGTTIADLGTGNNTGTLVNGSWSLSVPFTEGPATPIITTALPILYSSSPQGNQWYLNTNIISGATGTSYQPSQNGSYTLVVTDSMGCSATSSAVIITTLGIGQVGTQQLLANSNEIFEKLMFALPDEALISSELNLFNNTGQLVLKLSKGNVTKEVSLEGIVSGIYFLLLKTNTRSYSEKIIVH